MHAVDFELPFISETGFRSFLGCGPGLTAGVTFDVYVRTVVERHIAQELRGRLLPIAPEFRGGGSVR